MQKFCFLTALLAIVLGCNQISSSQLPEEDCWVSLHPSGEITTSEAPLTKSSTNDLFFIQVIRELNGDLFTDAFAFCVTDDMEGLKFNLKKGTAKYRFIVCLIKNGKNALESDYSSVNNTFFAYTGRTNTYAIDGINSYSFGSGYENGSGADLILNWVYYNSVGTYYYYLKGERKNGFHNHLFFKALDKACIREQLYCRCDDWLYGEITDYSPNGDFETLNVDLKRVGFKLKYELSGVTDGEVSVRIFNKDRTFFEETNSSSTYESATNFYAFYEARNTWLYADDYTENITVAVSWQRGIGITQDLGSTTVQVKRNCLNNIKIKLGSDDQSAGVSLSTEPESSIGAAAVTIPVQ